MDQKYILLYNFQIILMSSAQKYIHETLTLPSELPLFNYNINFEGLRKILEGVNIKTNNNQADITSLFQDLKTKASIHQMTQLQKKLSGSYTFGVHNQAYIDAAEDRSLKSNRTNLREMSQIDQFCWKMNKMAEILEVVYTRVDEHHKTIANNSKTYQKLIDQSFRRIDDKVNSNLDSFTKTINSFFSQANDKISQTQSSLNILKLNTESKIVDLSSDLGKKVSQNTLKAALEGSELKSRKQLESLLKNDQMQRLSTVNEVKNNFKQAEKDFQLKNKAMTIKVNELAEKVTKSLLINNFEIQKHKIYQKISELKNKSDQLGRKNNEFIQFRKKYMENSEKTKQEIIGLDQEIKKIKQKDEGMKKLEGMSNLLSSLDPHKICEIGQQVKLHEKELGKLQKSVLALQNLCKSRVNDKPVVENNSGQNSDLIQKIIKQFMSNMDFEGRSKRTQKDIMDLKKKNDTFSELQKKIYMLSKEIDMSAIMKELNKKADEDPVRKDSKIMSGKIDQLFDFYKQLRKEVQEKKRHASKSELLDNASLTTKRLMTSNCISCNPMSTTTANRRNYSKSKQLQMSLDYGLGIESQKNTIYSRLNK